MKTIIVISMIEQSCKNTKLAFKSKFCKLSIQPFNCNIYNNFDSGFRKNRKSSEFILLPVPQIYLLLVSVLSFKSFFVCPAPLSAWGRSLVLYAHLLNITSKLRGFVFKKSFRFTERLSRKYRDLPCTTVSPNPTQSFLLLTSCTLHATFVKIDEYILVHYY